MTAGSIVLAYNLKDVANLKLSRQAYAGVFLGKVKRWNDPLIAAANPDARLPDLPINVVVRADSSGYVVRVLPTPERDEARSSTRALAPIRCPTGRIGTKSKGNEGVTASIMTTPGSIGYIEFGYAKSQKVPMAVLENKAGKYVEATTASGQAALASAAVPDDMIVWASDPDVPDAYPIVTYTWLIATRSTPTRPRRGSMQDLVKYGLTEGQKDAESLGYIPLPASVVEKATAAVQNIGAQ